MRKLLLFLPLALLALCNTQPANAQPTDTSAINYINAVGDMPVYFQDAVDKFIKAEKANGTWSGMQMCLLFSPTQDMNKALIDAVTCTQVATYAYSTVPPSSLFVSNQVTPGHDGLIFDKSGTAYIKTGFI